MRVVFKRVIIVISSLGLLCTLASVVKAQTVTPTLTSTQVDQGKLTNLQDQIANYQKKISELQGQEHTLSSAITLLDSQAKLTQLKIDDTKEKIDEINQDIEVTKKRIGGLEINITNSTKAMLGRVSGVYQVGKMQPWEIFLSSGNINNFFTRLKYLQIVQAFDKKTLYAAEQSKVNYANQKSILEDKQKEAEALQVKLEGYTKQLAGEKKSKQDLLAATKSSESEYQRRLADASRELSQIQQAASFLVTTAPRHVNKGDVIGLMGNSGYSFGAHLHFGVYNVSQLSDYNYYSGHESPSNVLSSASVDWSTGCSGDPQGMNNTGSGSFAWPMSTGGLHITQNYGHTCYSDVYYQGKPHPAYDMYNNSDITIRAVEEGQAYICRNCTGDGGNGVFLFHSNGKMTLYWHLQ